MSCVWQAAGIYALGLPGVLSCVLVIGNADEFQRVTHENETSIVSKRVNPLKEWHVMIPMRTSLSRSHADFVPASRMLQGNRSQR